MLSDFLNAVCRTKANEGLLSESDSKTIELFTGLIEQHLADNPVVSVEYKAGMVRLNRANGVPPIDLQCGVEITQPVFMAGGGGGGGVASRGFPDAPGISHAAAGGVQHIQAFQPK